MKFLIFLFLLTACDAKKDRPPYPGKQHGYQHCHELYDLHYTFNVEKCEAAYANPKYIQGNTLKLKGVDKSCRATIIGIFSWTMTPIDEPTYKYKIYCNKRPMHDE
jgi:hypothetical protein